MKKRDLDAQLKALDCWLHREGGNHEVWTNEAGKMFTVPRHKEINELLARKILKQATEGV